jgi:GNAT superfamily N-acetyltransferase
MNVCVSPLKIKDIDLFYQKLNEYISDGLGFPEPALNYYRSIWNKEKISSDIDTNKNIYLTAWENKILNGILIGTQPEGGVATVVWVLVDRKMHKSGIGRLLFNEVCNYYRKTDCHKIKLTVPNEETTMFYEKIGMFLEGVHRNHWWGMDFWAMGFFLKA